MQSSNKLGSARAQLAPPIKTCPEASQNAKTSPHWIRLFQRNSLESPPTKRERFASHRNDGRVRGALVYARLWIYFQLKKRGMQGARHGEGPKWALQGVIGWCKEKERKVVVSAFIGKPHMKIHIRKFPGPSVERYHCVPFPKSLPHWRLLSLDRDSDEWHCLCNSRSQHKATLVRYNPLHTNENTKIL
jgi:hypothetical protein